MQDSSQASTVLNSVKVFYDLEEFNRWLRNATKISFFNEYYKIFISHSRSLRIFIGNKLYDVGLNDMIITNHMEYHKLPPQDFMEHEGIVIVFNPTYIKDSDTLNTDLTVCFNKRSEHFLHLRSLNQEQITQIDTYVRDIARGENSLEYGVDVLKKISLIELLILINRIYEEPGAPPSKSSLMSYQKTKPIIDYINKNIHTELTLELISQQFFISKYHLCRIFKASTGHTVNEYINSRRVFKACELLREGISIMHACEAVGIENTSHFISVFKNITGTTPKKYASKFSSK